MEDGLLSLKWNNHKITFCEILRTLREKSHYTDATIAVEGKFYPVHKLVLSTCSEYFEDIFARTPCKSPVIVLKDVRSQDMDALLDYMYLGEVNVNQNDLASLLKTAECLRIKGLAVPDEDIGKSRKAPSDERQNSPPPKRRRHDSSRPVSPPVSGTNKTPTPSASPIQPPPLGSHSSPDRLDSDPPPQIVKVEMHEHDQEDGFRKDSYEGSVNEEGGGDFGGDVSKTDHDPEGYGASSFPGPSLQPGGDLAWEEGDSSSFPPESFSGDVTSGQQPQGGMGLGLNVMGRLGLMQVALASQGLPPPHHLHPQPHPPPPPPPPHPHLHHHVLHPLSGGKEDAEDEVVTVALPRGMVSTGTATTTTTPAGAEEGLDDDLMPPTARMLHDLYDSSPLNFPHDTGHFVCKFCGKIFFYPSSLEKHMRTHTGERPFKCPQCPYSASQKSHVKTHVQRRHNREEGYFKESTTAPSSVT